MQITETAVPVPGRLWTPGAKALLGVVLIGLICGVYRFILGLQAGTNLSQQYPWGIWIVADVSFIALAASGFVTAALAHILHRHSFHSLVRPALIFALLGYTFACVLLAADLGRYYNIWHPLLPSMWQGNSALFEVGMCVMAYLTVLYLEAVPLTARWLMQACPPGKLRSLGVWAYRVSGKVMFVVVILGVAISCLHQSSLGHVMVLAKGKLHPFWWSPILALLFVTSAVVAALPTAIFVSWWGSKSLGLPAPMRTLGHAAKFLPLLLFAYLSLKVGDMLIRRSFVHLGEFNRQTISFAVEMVIGTVLPMVALMFRRVRFSSRGLAAACALVMFGVALNRANAYWIGYQPASATTFYVPSLVEVGFTLGAMAAVILLWRAIAMTFPVISTEWIPETSRSKSARHVGPLPERVKGDPSRSREPRQAPVGVVPAG